MNHHHDSPDELSPAPCVACGAATTERDARTGAPVCRDCDDDLATVAAGSPAEARRAFGRRLVNLAQGREELSLEDTVVLVVAQRLLALQGALADIDREMTVGVTEINLVVDTMARFTAYWLSGTPSKNAATHTGSYSGASCGTRASG